MRRVASFIAVFAFIAFAVAACARATREPAAAPDSSCGSCVRACVDRAHAHCRENDCERGCLLVLDRLVEREGDRVLSCVARAKACDDNVWADCAVLIGEHADGGPPPPPPAVERE